MQNAAVYVPITFEEIVIFMINSKIVCLQSPSILVQRPCRLRDDKRAMGTRMDENVVPHDKFSVNTNSQTPVPVPCSQFVVISSSDIQKIAAAFK